MNQCRVLAKIPSRWPFNPSYMHTFGVTDNYIILVEQSLCISLARLAQLTITHGPMTDALIWHGNEPVCIQNFFSQKEYFLYI
jgi:carotenoid cleavage dioxygenase-like enzyme